MAAEIARELVDRDPHNPQWWIDRASAVRLSESIDKAEAILRKAMEVHPTEAMIRFSLACLAGATGRISEAKAHLREAIELNEGVRQFILEDPDLTPVWNSICKDLPREEDDF